MGYLKFFKSHQFQRPEPRALPGEVWALPSFPCKNFAALGPPSDPCQPPRNIDLLCISAVLESTLKGSTLRGNPLYVSHFVLLGGWRDMYVFHFPTGKGDDSKFLAKSAKVLAA